MTACRAGCVRVVLFGNQGQCIGGNAAMNEEAFKSFYGEIAWNCYLLRYFCPRPVVIVMNGPTAAVGELYWPEKRVIFRQ